MKYEKPQKGNPHNLTIMQHVFPSKSISRFYDSEGKVTINHISLGKILRAKSDDQIFCAKRVWDQRAEAGYMKHIEDRYQALTDAVIKDERPIYLTEYEIITDMYILWNLRCRALENPYDDQKINGIEEPEPLTKDQQEILEKKHCGYFSNDMKMPARQFNGLAVQINIDRQREQLGGTRWSKLISKEGEFIVPDNCANTLIIPVTPTLCFLAQENDTAINRHETAAINRHFIKNSTNYWFARYLTACPL